MTISSRKVIPHSSLSCLVGIEMDSIDESNVASSLREDTECSLVLVRLPSLIEDQEQNQDCLIEDQEGREQNQDSHLEVEHVEQPTSSNEPCASSEPNLKN